MSSTPKPVLVATDLDRTMIYSRNASAGADAATVCVEHLDGAPLSYMTVTAAAAMRELAARAVVLPITTRTVAQFARIRFPGAPWPYAVTSNGGNILVDGAPDRQWRSGIDAAVRARGADLSEIGTALRARIDESWVLKYREADELFCYLVVDPAAMPAGFLAEWDAWCRPQGWSASRQGRKIYTMPRAVCKSRAVTEVRARLVAGGRLDTMAPILAAGDGALDAEMLAAADRAVRPRHGELEELGWTHPNLSVTAATGILAGEEIVDWFAAALPGRVGGPAG